MTYSVPTYYRVDRSVVINVSYGIYYQPDPNGGAADKRYYDTFLASPNYEHEDHGYNMGFVLWGIAEVKNERNSHEVLIGRTVFQTVFQDFDPTRASAFNNITIPTDSPVEVVVPMFMDGTNERFCEFYWRQAEFKVKGNRDRWLEFKASEINIVTASDEVQPLTYDSFFTDPNEMRRRRKTMKRKLLDDLLDNVTRYIDLSQKSPNKGHESKKHVKTDKKKHSDFNVMKI